MDLFSFVVGFRNVLSLSLSYHAYIGKHCMMEAYEDNQPFQTLASNSTSIAIAPAADLVSGNAQSMYTSPIINGVSARFHYALSPVIK